MSKKPEGEPPWCANIFIILIGLAILCCCAAAFMAGESLSTF